MSQAAVINAVRSRFATVVAAPNNLAVVYDNAPDPSGAYPAQWARFAVQIDTNSLVALSPRRWRMTGTAIAVLFCERRQGDGAVLALADSVINAFRGVSIAPMTTFTPAPTVSGGAEPDEAWCRRTVSIPFRADVVE